jgi:hypothetical protein
MRKDSATITGVTVVLTAAIIGGGYYMAIVRHPAQTSPESADAWQTLTPRPDQASGSARTVPDVPAGTSQGRTDTPIKCYDPELGEFWTNATTCDQADLNNRLSYSDPLATTPNRDQYSGQDYSPPGQEAVNSRSDNNAKPDLRLSAKSPPSGLNVACKFSVGMALEIERDLAAADQPYESIRRDTYCEFRCEVIAKNCPIRDDYFYYSFHKMCQGTEYLPCFGTSG